ncbi:MAG TPA: hypothetical protein PKA10_06035 [Selenomonadales bacterium]|nr:hypothetical protein [Selenomonadales bacterium]
MELQDFHLVNYRGAEFSDVVSLIQLQNTYINQIYKLVYVLNNDFAVASNNEFQEFTAHFNYFAQHQASSEGFSRAMEAVQVYHYVLLEKLLDNQVLSAAEQLELAAGYVETIVRDPKMRSNPQILLLNQSISLLEENQLKIMENLEALLIGSRQTHYQN